MKQHLLPILFLLSFFQQGFSQERKYQRINGKIKLDTETFCLYKEIPVEYLNRVCKKKEFTDVAFYSTDSLPVIYMEASALSLYRFQKLDAQMQQQLQLYGMSGSARIKRQDDHLRLINYYRVEFGPMQRELNILYHHETLHYFIKDLIWYQVFENGKFNEAGAEKTNQEMGSKAN